MTLKSKLRNAKLRLQRKVVPGKHCPLCQYYVIGRCWRWPPEGYSPVKEAIFPMVTAEMWCGEFVDSGRTPEQG